MLLLKVRWLPSLYVGEGGNSVDVLLILLCTSSRRVVSRTSYPFPPPFSPLCRLLSSPCPAIGLCHAVNDPHQHTHLHVHSTAYRTGLLYQGMYLQGKLYTPATGWTGADSKRKTHQLSGLRNMQLIASFPLQARLRLDSRR